MTVLDILLRHYPTFSQVLLAMFEICLLMWVSGILLGAALGIATLSDMFMSVTLEKADSTFTAIGKEKNMYSVNAHSGNVLFLILIAVALFAALSYAVTSSTRSGQGNASSEKATTDIAVMMQYTSAMRQAVQRLILSNGCTDQTINAYSPNWTISPDDYRNTSSPSDGSCDLFSSSGGDFIWQKPPPSAVLNIILTEVWGSQISDWTPAIEPNL